MGNIRGWVAWAAILGMAMTGCGRLGFDPLASEVRAEDAAPELPDPDGGTFEPIVDAATGNDEPVPCEGLAGAVFCDGFEDPNLEAKWAFSPAVDAPVSSTDKSWKGQRAMRGDSPGAGAKVTGGAALSRSVTDGMLYLRVHVFLPSEAEMPLRHIDFLDLYSAGIVGRPNTGSLAFAAVGDVPGEANEGQLLVVAGTVDADGNETSNIHTYSARNALPRGRWFCMQVSTKIGVTGSVSVKVDGEPIVDVSDVSTTVPGGYRTVVAPISFTWSGQGRSTIYLDELAVGTEPLDCAMH